MRDLAAWHATTDSTLMQHCPPQMTRRRCALGFSTLYSLVLPKKQHLPMAANQNESLKRPRGENPFKGGKRNSAFWAILTTLDPECACSEERGRRRGIYCESVPSSSLARDTACQKLENRNGNEAFSGLGKMIAKFYQVLPLMRLSYKA